MLKSVFLSYPFRGMQNLSHRIENYTSKRKWIFLFYGAILLFLVCLKHYTFNSSAFDLGIYINALFDYAHLRVNESTLLFQNFPNKLGDHFSIFQFLFAPFQYIFGSYTLLIFQVLFVLIGALGVFKFVTHLSKSEWYGDLSIIFFLTFWSLYPALGFDYHDNVIGAMMVPWFFFFFKQRKWVKTIVVFSAILLCKETTAMWMIFISMGLFLQNLRDSQKRIWAITFVFSAAIYFLVVLKVIMPSLRGNEVKYQHFKYKTFGTTLTDVPKYMVKHPAKAVKYLFVDHTGKNSPNKKNFWIALILAGGFSLVLRPSFLLMVAPIFVLKIYNDDIAKWGLDAHYNIEFAPIVTLALFSWVSSRKENWNGIQKKLIPLVIVGISLTTLIQLSQNRHSKRHFKVIRPSTFKQDFKIVETHQLLGEIPNDAIISAQSNLVPHLAQRDRIYLFPDIKDAEYIAIHEKLSTYPMSKEDYEKRVSNLQKNENWTLLMKEESGLYIFKRNN